MIGITWHPDDHEALCPEHAWQALLYELDAHGCPTDELPGAGHDKDLYKRLVTAALTWLHEREQPRRNPKGPGERRKDSTRALHGPLGSHTYRGLHADVQ